MGTTKPAWWVLEVKNSTTGKTISVHITLHHPESDHYGFTMIDDLEKKYGEGYEVWRYDSYTNKKVAFDNKHRLQSYLQDMTDRERGKIYNKQKR